MASACGSEYGFRSSRRRRTDVRLFARPFHPIGVEFSFKIYTSRKTNSLSLSIRAFVAASRKNSRRDWSNRIFFVYPYIRSRDRNDRCAIFILKNLDKFSRYFLFAQDVYRGAYDSRQTMVRVDAQGRGRALRRASYDGD